MLNKEPDRLKEPNTSSPDASSQADGLVTGLVSAVRAALDVLQLVREGFQSGGQELRASGPLQQEEPTVSWVSNHLQQSQGTTAAASHHSVLE